MGDHIILNVIIMIFMVIGNNIKVNYINLAAKLKKLKENLQEKLKFAIQ